MIFMLATALILLATDCRRHSWSKMMGLRRSKIAISCVLLTVISKLLLEAQDISHVIILHILRWGCKCLSLATATSSALMMLRYLSATANTSTIIVWTCRAWSTPQLLTSSHHLFLSNIVLLLTLMMLHHLLGLTRWRYTISSTLSALILATSFTNECCTSRRRG